MIYEWIANPSNPRGQFRYKVFEFVPGARIVGRAAPRAEIRVKLRLKTSQNRRISYAARTTASAEGVYTLRVPYANSTLDRAAPHASEVFPANRYEIHCKQERGFVQVSEEAVTNGEDVQAPDICVSE